MSFHTLPRQDGVIAHLIHRIGTKLLPSELVGGLTLTLPSGQQHSIGFERPGIQCDLQLANYRPVWAAVRRGAVGFAESYMAGDITTSDLTALLRFYLQNRDVLDKAGSPVFFKSLFDKLFHVMRANTKAGSRRNISAHYDLGNNFYALWLDPGMSYSSGYFGKGAEGLEGSQDAKYRLVLDAIDARPSSHILEIGCGWGGFAEAAAGDGHRVTGITISREQLNYASERLGEKADLRFEDYRDTAGQFDGIASIEMIEAVGEAHWPTYFKVIHDRLKPGAAAAIQAITIDERFYAGYRATTDFIQRYIFPGGMLPTKSILAEQAARAGLAFETLQTFGLDYAKTCAMWRDRFEAAWGPISRLGFDEQFRRRWRYYLCYCEAGFAEAAIDVGVYRFRRLK